MEGNLNALPPRYAMPTRRNKATTVMLVEHGLYRFQRVERIGKKLPSLSKKRRAPKWILRTADYFNLPFARKGGA
jgi:hypothetical protein